MGKKLNKENLHFFIIITIYLLQLNFEFPFFMKSKPNSLKLNLSLSRFEVFADSLCVKTVPAFMNTVGITAAMVTGDTMPFINFRVRSKFLLDLFMMFHVCTS